MGKFTAPTVHGNEMVVYFDEGSRYDRVKTIDGHTHYARVSEQCCLVVTRVRNGVVVDQWDTQADDWWNPPAGHVRWEDKMDQDKLAKFWDHYILHQMIDEDRRLDACDVEFSHD
jgi:hypothetical protein